MFIWKKEFMELIVAKQELASRVFTLSIDNARLEAGEDKLASKVASTETKFNEACDRIQKLEAVLLKQQDQIVSLQSTRKAHPPEESDMDIFSEAAEDIQRTVDDIQKYGRDAVIVREA